VETGTAEETFQIGFGRVLPSGGSAQSHPLSEQAAATHPSIEMAGSMIICQPPFPLPAFTAAALFLSEFRAAAADE